MKKQITLINGGQADMTQYLEGVACFKRLKEARGRIAAIDYILGEHVREKSSFVRGFTNMVCKECACFNAGQSRCNEGCPFRYHKVAKWQVMED
jgi:hypothetical protein